MATISIAGTVTGGTKGADAVTLKTFARDNGTTDALASFSVADQQFVYTKPGDESIGQFYRCEVRGKAAEICADRLAKGDKVAVTGQLVQRMYNDQRYYDLKNANVTFLTKKEEASRQDLDVPF